MKLLQLRYVWEVANNGLNISTAAEALYTSQPGVSKQIRLLEDELGVAIFERAGRQLTAITPAGSAIIEIAGRIIAETENIRLAAQEYSDDQRGCLSIATTHTQARYVLPRIVAQFRQDYPDVALHMHQGTPVQIAELAANRRVDFAIATEALELFENLIMLPCYRWNRSVVVPHGHPLCDSEELSLAEVAKYPILTYVFGFTGRSQLDRAFSKNGLNPRVVFTAVDADVIKTYIRAGLGIGIIASLAYDEAQDKDLIALKAHHLFDHSVTKIGFRRGTYLRGYMYRFLELFAPHLTTDVVDTAQRDTSRRGMEQLFQNLDLPSY